MFSSRLRQGAARNRLSLALSRRRAARLPIVDLTLSNPTKAGIAYPSNLLDSLRDRTALSYDPEPFGLPAARCAVAADLQRRGLRIAADRIVLTASTSEAYSILFKLLCDPGDTVLAPRPSYPLVEHLTDLDGVALTHYNLDFHGRWSVDLTSLADQLSRTAARAIVVINPNNPTGSVLTRDEIDEIAQLARDRDAAVIADEVFADYAITSDEPTSVLTQDSALTFALGGLSKSVGLPQLKLGWIAVGGPSTLVSQAMERLETICDAYLSVGTPVQVAASELLRSGGEVRDRVRERVRRNFRAVADIGRSYPASRVLPAQAGWYAVVQVPAVAPEETMVVDLLEQKGILVHPGYFFDFEREAFLIVSLLPEPDVFDAGVSVLFAAVGGSP